MRLAIVFVLFCVGAAVVAAATKPYARGTIWIEPNGRAMVLRRSSSGGAAGAFTMGSDGKWDDKSIPDAQPNVVQALNTVTQYFDQVIANSP